LVIVGRFEFFAISIDFQDQQRTISMCQQSISVEKIVPSFKYLLYKLFYLLSVLDSSQDLSEWEVRHHDDCKEESGDVGGILFLLFVIGKVPLRKMQNKLYNKIRSK